MLASSPSYYFYITFDEHGPSGKSVSVLADSDEGDALKDTVGRAAHL